MEEVCAEAVLMLCLQLLLDCSELEARLGDTLSLVNTDDYGKDQPATSRLLTKHQVRHTDRPEPHICLICESAAVPVNLLCPDLCR